MIFKRLAIIIYDSFILVAVFVFFTLFLVIARQVRPIPPGTVWYQVLLIALAYIYYGASYKTSGQTIGMRVWQAKIIFEGKATYKLIFLRITLSSLAFILGILSLCSPDKYLKKWTKSQLVFLAK
jgi:uncharacterized RDD family membrane protein YckC